MTRVVALVPARDEADRIAATVAALRAMGEVDEVVVADDASSDGTGSVALAAGATVLRVRRHLGKGGVMEAVLRRIDADAWLFADADLGETASALVPVLDEVLAGRADLAIAVLPAQEGGGFGLVKRAAAGAIHAACGFDAVAPLSGQRAVMARALAACRPLARGFGVETAMTIDAVRAGFRVHEVAADASHRPTGRDLGGFAHRGRQGLDIATAALLRLGGLR
ncbi:MAG: glycosyltransferase family 2 protein [Actinomycetota bacterium]